MALTYIFYYIPEDNDDPDQMNYFCIQKPANEIHLPDIRKYFPLTGEYHFRFQYKYQGTTVWLDISNEKGSLPQIEGMIIMKVLRLKWRSGANQI